VYDKNMLNLKTADNFTPFIRIFLSMPNTEGKLTVMEQREWTRMLEFPQWNWALLEQLK
jgi:hypothetical protein